MADASEEEAGKLGHSDKKDSTSAREDIDLKVFDPKKMTYTEVTCVLSLIYASCPEHPFAQKDINLTFFSLHVHKDCDLFHFII